MTTRFAGTQARMVVGIASVVVVALLVGALYVGRASAAGGPPFSQVQLITQGFPSQRVPGDFTTFVTVQQIPFSTSGQSQVQITSLFTFVLSGGSFGEGGKLACNLTLDSVIVSSITRDEDFTGADMQAGVTTTQSVSSGSHVVALACTSFNPEDPTTDGFAVLKSNGTSLIIAG